MKPFLFLQLLLRQRLDERIAIERVSPRRNPASLKSLERRKLALVARLRRSLGRPLRAGG